MERKIYLSKSNKANYDNVAILRKELKLRKFEVLEHTGGTWDPSKIKNVPLFIVPPTQAESPIITHNCVIGKGQRSEFDEKTMRAALIDFEYKVFAIVDEVVTIDETNWTEHSSMVLDDSSFLESFDDLLKLFGFKYKLPTKKNKVK